jgi:hypothetical protein
MKTKMTLSTRLNIAAFLLSHPDRACRVALASGCAIRAWFRYWALRILAGEMR